MCSFECRVSGFESAEPGSRGIVRLLEQGFRKALRLLLLLALGSLLTSCSAKPDPNTLVMMIESSPTNLDPRVGTDAQSERIDELLFDSLVRRDEHFNLHPWLAERWETPDPLTYVFHLRQGVRFHNGQPLTARDVKWTLDSLLQGKVRSTKSASYRYVDRVEAPDDATVIFRLKEPFATLLWNLSDGAIGIVPYGTLDELAQKPVGSGPFRFVSAALDKDVVVERNPDYWGDKSKVERVRFAVIPDMTTRALELRKGSADIAINALSADVVRTLEHEPPLAVQRAPGTIYAYLALNVRDPLLADARVRQALAYAIDRQPLIEYLWRGQARPANSVLPPQSWAFDGSGAQYPHDPVKANALLDEAGYPPKNGVRFRLTMKTSTEETTRLLAAVFQQQLREVGVALEIRSFEPATFLSDVTHGAFQMYSLRWIGGNQDPEMFEHVFLSTNFPPAGQNRSHYANALVDSLIERARHQADQQKRKETYARLQHVLNEDLPYIHLWYFDNVMVHTRRVRGLELNPAGNYDFLRTAELAR
jgi:peptide/nickel transport system substrate-binding protein